MDVANVLVVENDLALSDMLQMLLEQELSLKVTIAKDREEALKVLASGIPRLVIADVLVPGARDVAELVRKAKPARPPILMLLGPFDEDRNIFRGTGYDVITLPFTVDAFIQKVRNHIYGEMERAASS